MTRPSFQPAVITRSDPKKVVIRWSDGHESSFTAAELRGVCPCAQCVDELSGRRRHDPRTVPDDLEQTQLQMVGNYAVSMRFSDGHHTGIYTFQYLRESDPSGG